MMCEGKYQDMLLAKIVASLWRCCILYRILTLVINYLSVMKYHKLYCFLLGFFNLSFSFNSKS